METEVRGCRRIFVQCGAIMSTCRFASLARHAWWSLWCCFFLINFFVVLHASFTLLTGTHQLHWFNALLSPPVARRRISSQSNLVLQTQWFHSWDVKDGGFSLQMKANLMAQRKGRCSRKMLPLNLICFSSKQWWQILVVLGFRVWYAHWVTLKKSYTL